MEIKKNDFKPEITYKLTIENGSKKTELICEIFQGNVYSEIPIDESSIFCEADEMFYNYDFYATELDNLIQNNQSIHISKHQ